MALNIRERAGTLCARVARALPLLRRRIEARLADDSDYRAANRVRPVHTLPSVRSHER